MCNGVPQMSPEPTVSRCPNCGSPVEPRRVFCRLSCRVRFEHREFVRTPKLFASDMTLESELPTREEVKEARRQRR